MPEVVHVLADVLHRLPLHCAAALLLVVVKGKTYEEVGQILNVDVATVRAWLLQAREAIRAATPEEL